MNNKSPAFQFYPADYLSDMNVALMNNTQRGCYWTLMSHEWLAKGNGISNQISELAKLCGESEEEMALLWKGLEVCFIPHPKNSEKLIHPRLEKERKKQKENRKRRVSAGKKGAKARWTPDSNAIGLPMAKNSLSSSSSSSTSTTVNKGGEKKSAPKEKKEKKSEPSETVIAEEWWVVEYERLKGKKPLMSPAKDRKIIKELIAISSLEEVKRRMTEHLTYKSTMLTIGGLKTCWNDDLNKKPGFETWEEKNERELQLVRDKYANNH